MSIYVYTYKFIKSDYTDGYTCTCIYMVSLLGTHNTV